MASFLEQISGSSSIPQSVKNQLATKTSNSTNSSPTVASVITSPQSASGINTASYGLSSNDLDLYTSLANNNNKYASEEAAINREFQAEQAELANSFSAKEAQKNRDFQLEMSNTSYQRAVEDLKKAGLNPILAYSNGGASTASGSTAQAHQASGSQASIDTNTVASLINANLSRQTSLKIAQIQADSARQVAEINSNSSKYGFWTNFLESALGTEDLGDYAKDTVKKAVDWLTGDTTNQYVSTAKKVVKGIAEYNKVKNNFNKTRKAVNDWYDNYTGGNT